MSGCIDCGRPTRKARCQTCRVEHCAPQISDDGECPGCGRDQLTHRECEDCRRAKEIVGDLDEHDDDLRTDGGQERYVVAEWTESPFTSHDRRGDTIEHRVVITHYEGTGADVCHEYRSQDADSYPSEWMEGEAYELRDHGLRRVQRNTEVLRS